MKPASRIAATSSQTGHGADHSAGTDGRGSVGLVLDDHFDLERFSSSSAYLRLIGSVEPPIKLYLASPAHFAAGAGNPAGSKGAKLNGAEVMKASLVLCWFDHKL
jgi:hypothetical protein